MGSAAALDKVSVIGLTAPPVSGRVGATKANARRSRPEAGLKEIPPVNWRLAMVAEGQVPPNPILAPLRSVTNPGAAKVSKLPATKLV